MHGLIERRLGRHGELLARAHHVEQRRPLMPIASAMAAKLGFLRSQPVSKKPLAFISISTKPRVPLLSTITFTGRPSWLRLMKSPIIIEKPPSPDSEITWRWG